MLYHFLLSSGCPRPIQEQRESSESLPQTPPSDLNETEYFLQVEAPVQFRFPLYFHSRIFVISQEDDLKFNRAMLLNVGYKEAMKTSHWDCLGQPRPH